MTISSIILHCKACRKFTCSLDLECLDLNGSNQLAELFLKLIYDLNVSVICESCQECQEHCFEHEHLES
jgi:hypothetical protein